MNTQTINNWGLVELDNQSQINIDGGKLMEDVGYAFGYLCGAATNAAGILGNAIKDVLVGEIVGGAVKR